MTSRRSSLMMSFRPLMFVVLVLWGPNLRYALASEGPSQLLEDTKDEVTKLGGCSEDTPRATTCRACASLPYGMLLPAEECCSDSDARLICEECLADPGACMEQLAKLEATVLGADDAEDEDADDGYYGDDLDPNAGDLDPNDLFAAGFGAGVDVADFYNGEDGEEGDGPEPFVDKRFGTLFLGKRPLYFTPSRLVQADVMKRDSGDGDIESDDFADVDKRWGRLGLATDKRWGSLGIGNGKRWGSLGIGKRWGSLGIGKKWGSLGIGKRWGSLGIGKRWGSLGIGNWKRWGSLGLDRWGSRRLGKRSATQDTDLDQSKIPEEEKRWGSLGIGSGRFGKRWGSLGLGNWRKRWGSLGIGKRWGSLGIGNGKRWGSLGIGKRWGSLGIGKRWGSLGIGKRWGSLGIGNGKRWGTLGFGKRSETTSDQDEERLSALLGGLKKRWGTLHFGKRWGTLGGFERMRSGVDQDATSKNKRWGTLSLGKKWGTLGGFGVKRSDDESQDSASEADKKWGSLGLNGKRGDEKRWGTLNFGKKSDGSESETIEEIANPAMEKRWGTLFIRGKKSSSPTEKTK